MSWSTRSDHVLISLMTILEAAIRASTDPLFGAEGSFHWWHSNVGLGSNVKWGAALTTAIVKAAVHKEIHVELESRPTKSHCPNGEEVIARVVKYAMKDLVTRKLSSMIEKWFDDLLCKSFHNTQTCIQSVVYNVLEVVVLYLLHKDGAGSALETH